MNFIVKAVAAAAVCIGLEELDCYLKKEKIKSKAKKQNETLMVEIEEFLTAAAGEN